MNNTESLSKIAYLIAQINSRTPEPERPTPRFLPPYPFISRDTSTIFREYLATKVTNSINDQM